MCNSPQRVYILRGVQRRCVVSCLVWCGGVNWPPDKCVLRRSASGGRNSAPDTLRHTPDTEHPCLAVEPTQFTDENALPIWR